MASKSLVKRHVLVNGRRVRALFDSGATRSFISPEAAKRIGLQTVDGASLRVQVANGNEGSTKGSALVQVSMGTQEDVTFGARLFVYDLPSHDVILGEDFMSQHQCTLDFGQRVISIMDGEGVHHDVTEPIYQKRSMQGVVRATEELCSILGELVGEEEDISSSWTYMRDIANGDTPPDKHDNDLSPIWADLLFIDAEGDATTEERSPEELVKTFLDAQEIEENMLSGKGRIALTNLLKENASIIRAKSGTSGLTTNSDLPRCRLRLRDDKDEPVAGRYYKVDAQKIEFLQKLLTKWEKNKLIEPSSSRYGAPAMLVAKKEEGQYRLVCDFRSVNAKLIPDAYPLPTAESLFERIGAKPVSVMSLFDLVDGYNQMVLEDEQSRDLTTFVTPLGAWRYLVLAQGLSVAPGNFQRFMTTVFRSCREFTCIYLDDLLVYSKDEKEHLQHLEALFTAASAANLQISTTKSELFKKKAKFLGHVLELQDGVVHIRAQEDKLKAIREWPRPRCTKELQAFLGLANYYHRLIRDFANLATPLLELGKVEFSANDEIDVWTDEHQEAFEALKQVLTSDQVVISPRMGVPFTITADASVYAIGGTIEQTIEGKNYVIAYVSKKLPERARRWPTHERELYALVHIAQKYIHLLRGQTVTYIGDHKPLLYLQSQSTISDKVARWLTYPLSEIQWTMKWRAGKEMAVADALSRSDEAGATRAKFSPSEPVLALCEMLTKDCPLPLVLRDELLYMDMIQEEPLVDFWLHDTRQESLQTWVDELCTVDASWGGNETLAAPGDAGGLPMTAAFVEQLTEALREDDLSRSVLAGERVQGYNIGEGGMVFKTSDVGAHPVLHIPSHAIHLHNALMTAAHTNILSGHSNAKTTYDRLARYVHWDQMRQHVDKYVRTCNTCARCVTANTRKNQIPFTFPTPSHAFETIGVDELILGVTKKGNTGIWVVTDHLTRRVILMPNGGNSTSSEALAKLLLNHVVGNWGVPLKIVSDRGPQLVGDAYQSMCRSLSIRPNVSTAESPQTNGLVERTNQLVTHVMRKLLDEFGEDWDEYLYAAMFAINDSPREAIGGYTPFQLSTGRSPSLPIGALLLPILRRSPAVKDSTAKEYLRNFMKAMSIARRELHAYNLEQVERRRAHAPLPNYYQPGQLVWYDRRAGAKTHGAKVHKLEPTRQGPYEVIKQGQQNSYYLKANAPTWAKSENLSVTMPVNGRHLSPYHGDIPERDTDTVEEDLDEAQMATRQEEQAVQPNAMNEPMNDGVDCVGSNPTTMEAGMNNDGQGRIMTRSQQREQRERTRRQIEALVIKPTELGLHFPPAIKAHQRDLRTSKHNHQPLPRASRV